MKQKIIGALTCLLAVCMVSGLVYADETDSVIAPDDQAAEYAEDDLYLTAEEEEYFSDVYASEISAETEENADIALPGEEPELLNAGTALPAASGTIGDSVTWEITGETSSRTLTISGKGRIEGQPWEAYRDGIVYVVIEDGITEIGTEAFVLSAP